MTIETAVAVELQGNLAGYGMPTDAVSRLREVMATTLRHVGLAGWYDISLVLTTDQEIQRVNRRHRGIDRPTDVLSFPQSDVPLLPLPPDEAWMPHEFGDDTHAAPTDHDTAPQLAVGASPADATTMTYVYGTADAPYLLGDIIISVPMVARQAASARHSAWYELCFLVAHGTLHLIGYDDYYEPGYHAMVAHQEATLTTLAIS